MSDRTLGERLIGLICGGSLGFAVATPFVGTMVLVSVFSDLDLPFMRTLLVFMVVFGILGWLYPRLTEWIHLLVSS